MAGIRSRIRQLLAFSRRIPFVVPVWEAEEFACMWKLFLAGRLVHGESIATFQKAICDLHDLPYAVPTNLARSAIEIALKAVGVSRGDAVLLPTYVCGAAALPILRRGARPVFCDVGKDFNIADVQLRITPSVKAILVIHSGGKLVNIDPIVRVARRHNIAIIEDACQAFGARYPDGAYAGTKGTVGIFSFGMGKNLMATGGGMAITKDAILFAKMQESCIKSESPGKVFTRLFRVLWQFRFRKYTSLPTVIAEYVLSRWRKSRGPLPYEITQLSNLDAALMEQQLKKMHRILTGRKRNAHRLNAILAPHRRWVRVSPDGIYTKYLLTFSKGSVEERMNMARNCRRFFAERGIELEESAVPLHLRKPFRQYSTHPLPNAEQSYRATVVLPVRPNLTIRERQRVEQVLRIFLQRNGQLARKVKR